jgi:hypothetical protein
MAKQESQKPSRRGKSAPRKKSRFSKMTIPETVKKVRKAALPLLRGLSATDIKTWPEEARKVVSRLVLGTRDSNVSLGDKVLFLLSCALSIKHLPGYATLDSNHIKQISTFIETVRRYIDDTSQKRPLNFLMLASPGAGKSHFIKCIAASLQSDNLSAITFNMAGLQRNEDLSPPLDAARNLKVEDRIPLLFLDEFDSKESNIALLLPLLWDGELNLGQRELKLGKVVIVLAGSDPSLPTTMDHARTMRVETAIANGRNPKLIDLLSRVNGGVIPIPPFHDPSKEIDRRMDKVCIAVQLLRQRFGQGLRSVPLALLRFLALAEFRYGVRSMAHVIELIPYKKVEVLKIDALDLPFKDPRDLKDSSLAYHLLHEEQAYGVTKLWAEVSQTSVTLPVFTEAAYYLQVEELFWLDYQLDMLMKEIHAAGPK